MIYHSKITGDFIKRRNDVIKDALARGNKPENIEFRFDCEWPEHHQCLIDPRQRLHEGFAFDVIDEGLGNVDYKIYSQNGIHVSDYIAEQVIKGKINYFCIWTWCNYPDRPLKEGDEVDYKILGHVRADHALLSRDPETKRFPFIDSDVEEITDD